MSFADWIGAYGAALSSALALWRWHDTRPRIRITIYPAYNSPAYDPPGSFYRAGLLNRGAKPVFMRAAWLLLPNRRPTLRQKLRHFIRYRRGWSRIGMVSYPLPDEVIRRPALPAAIEPGRVLELWFPQETVDGMLQTKGDRFFVVAAQDELERTYYSESYFVTTPAPAT